jgi:hypothetical protein
MSADLPLSPRRHVHTRRITCEGFEREDGLLEIEGLLVDTKPTSLEMPTRHLPAGEPIHQMRVVLVLDGERTILQVRAVTEHSPYPVCGAIASTYERLVGLRIEPGFTQQVKRMFRGTLGCSHLTEMLPTIASTVFQMLWSDSEFDGADEEGSATRTSPLGGCHALKLDGEVVRTYFPHIRGAAR